MIRDEIRVVLSMMSEDPSGDEGSIVLEVAPVGEGLKEEGSASESMEEERRFAVKYAKPYDGFFHLNANAMTFALRWML